MVVQAWALQKTTGTEAGKELIEKKLSAEKDSGFAETIRTIFNKQRLLLNVKDVNLLVISEIADLK
jgi:ASC-1-like (ASCH) protein